jgi:hypothetical protein
LEAATALLCCAASGRIFARPCLVGLLNATTSGSGEAPRPDSYQDATSQRAGRAPPRFGYRRSDIRCCEEMKGLFALPRVYDQLTARARSKGGAWERIAGRDVFARAVT